MRSTKPWGQGTTQPRPCGIPNGWTALMQRCAPPGPKRLKICWRCGNLPGCKHRLSPTRVFTRGCQDKITVSNITSKSPDCLWNPCVDLLHHGFIRHQWHWNIYTLKPTVTTIALPNPNQDLGTSSHWHGATPHHFQVKVIEKGCIPITISGRKRSSSQNEPLLRQLLQWQTQQ